jgi:hypothetical protein
MEVQHGLKPTAENNAERLHHGGWDLGMRMPGTRTAVREQRSPHAPDENLEPVFNQHW